MILFKTNVYYTSFLLQEFELDYFQVYNKARWAPSRFRESKR